MKKYFHIPVTLSVPADTNLVPVFCPFCQDTLSTSPNLEAYSHTLIGYMYHCQRCDVQIRLEQRQDNEL